MIEKLEKLVDGIERPEVTIEELMQWKNHPVTKLLCCDFFAEYFTNLELLCEMIPVDDEARASHAMAVGEQGVYKKLLDYVANIKAELEEKDRESK